MVVAMQSLSIDGSPAGLYSDSHLTAVIGQGRSLTKRTGGDEPTPLKTMAAAVLTNSGSKMLRTKSNFSLLSDKSAFSANSSVCSETDESTVADATDFQQGIHDVTQGSPHSPDFASLRVVMEPHLARARSRRERACSRILPQFDRVTASVGSCVGVPYPALRKERAFLFDAHTFPLEQELATALGVSNLASVHNDLPNHHDSPLLPLLDAKQRRDFHLAYINFVNSFCIPLLHELAMKNRLFHTQSSSGDCITYRYQAFPNISVHRPGNHQSCSSAPRNPLCDVAEGHSIGCIRFHVPLTPSQGTAAVYTESFPGREDWHPLSVKQTGLGYIFDAARCIHFDLQNTTDTTRVSLDFSVILYDPNPARVGHDEWTPLNMVEDALSRAGPGYYQETTGIDAWTHQDKRSKIRHLWTPDARCGPPFSTNAEPR